MSNFRDSEKNEVFFLNCFFTGKSLLQFLRNPLGIREQYASFVIILLLLTVFCFIPLPLSPAGSKSSGIKSKATRILKVAIQ